MKKKTGKIIGGALLGVLFVVLLGIYCWQYDVGNIREVAAGGGEGTSKTLVKGPEPKKQDTVSYKMGEDVKAGIFVWNVSEAEIVSDIAKLDVYYQEKPRFQDAVNPEKRGFDKLEGDIQFLFLKYTVTNTSDHVGKTITPTFPELYNRTDKNRYVKWSRMYFGGYGRCISTTGGASDVGEDDKIVLQAGETIEMECVLGFSEYDGGAYSEDECIYDLYLSTGSYQGGLGEVNMGSQTGEKICLEIAPKHVSAAQTDLGNSVIEQRDIPAMKSRQWTNLEMKQYQRQGYLMPYDKDPDVVLTEEENVTEQGTIFSEQFGKKVQITDSKVVGWGEMPKAFEERTALTQMAEHYASEYGYTPEQMKILLLDIEFTGTSGLEKTRIDFYAESFLFTRDGAGKRWIFGTADDWIVTSADSGRVGHINMELLGSGEKTSVQMAYILPPEILSEQALYFCGGEIRERYYKEGRPSVAEIKLQ